MTSMIIQGDFLVQGSSSNNDTPSGTTVTTGGVGEADGGGRGAGAVHPVLGSDVALSFWGGIDETTSEVIDKTHPLFGRKVEGTILCLPSARGSCTASQVLLELILNGRAPRAIVLRDVDGLACVGALVAQEMFHQVGDGHGHRGAAVVVPDIVVVGRGGYERILLSAVRHEGRGDRTGDCDRGGGDDIGHLRYGSISSDGNFVMGADEETALAALRQHEDKVSKANAAGTVSTSSPSSTSRDINHQYTPEEQRMISESRTEAERMALNVLFRYAHIVSKADSSDQPSYVPVASAHIDGCTYIGPGGLHFVERLVEAGGQVKVPTTLNSMSTDRRRWRSLGVPADYANSANALGDAYLKLGCQPSFTCAPYLLLSGGNDGESLVGRDVAWGESNAVVYANSVLGARTEKYADYLDICCAITGMAPRVGVHVPSNREPRIALDATEMMSSIFTDNPNRKDDDFDMLFPILGHLCGTMSDGKVPILLGLDNDGLAVTADHLKAFCAAFGTTGSSPLIHIAGVTPEAKDPAIVDEWVRTCGDNRRVLTAEMLQETFQILDSDDGADERVHLIAIGNPHLSLSECENLAGTIQRLDATSSSDEKKKTKKHPGLRVIACLSRTIQSQADELGYIHPLEEFGMEFVNDTCWCMLLDPPVIPEDPNAKILTNSGKYSHYGPGLTNRKFRFGSMEDCIQAATTGIYAKKKTKRAAVGSSVNPSWLGGGARSYATSAVRTSRWLLRYLK